MSVTHLPLRRPGRGRHLIAAVVFALIGVLTVTLFSAQADARKRKKPHSVKVMTRNLYLGSVLDAAAAAPDTDTLCEEAGEILRDVTATNFPKRAIALGQEIRSRQPDLVGLQEAALWLTDTPSDAGPLQGGTPALVTRVDYIGELLKQVNKGPAKNYRLVVSRNEFDFETAADEDNAGPPGCAGAEIDGRLIMRDAILARNGSGVRTLSTNRGQFNNLADAVVSGVPIPFIRGWVSTRARVRGSKPFTFVNTHLESFDDGTIRDAQAKELLAGPAKGPGRVIMLGDFNSDVDDTGTDLAYKSIIAGGFFLRQKPQVGTSGVPDELLVNGSAADFDRQIDLIFVNKRRMRLLKTSVFGKAPVNGLFPTDHAGVFSKIKLP